MGVGKSAVAPVLAELMGVPLVNMSRLIHTALGGRTTDQIVDELGMDAYRETETRILAEQVQTSGNVFSCGGGITTVAENIRLMKEHGTVIWMTASPETILDHLKDDDTRPNLRGRKTVEGIAEFMEERRPMYECAADMTFCVDGLTIEEVAKGIYDIL